jgi:hypothetical protein
MKMELQQGEISKDGPLHLEDIKQEAPLEKLDASFQMVPSKERRVVLKLDLFLLPVLIFIFILLFLDRANIGNARVAGLQKDIAITDYQYATGRYAFSESYYMLTF